MMTYGIVFSIFERKRNVGENPKQPKKSIPFANHQESREYGLLSSMFAAGWAMVGALIGVFYIEPQYLLDTSHNTLLQWSNTVSAMCIPACLVLLAFSGIFVLGVTFHPSEIKHRSARYKQFVGTVASLVIITGISLAIYFYKNPGIPVDMLRILFPAAISVCLGFGTATTLLYLRIRRKPLWQFPFMT